MGRLVVLKVGEGSFEGGFPVTLQIGEEGDAYGKDFVLRPLTEITGRLPAAPEILQYYNRWTSSYRDLRLGLRLEKPAAQKTNESVILDCRDATQALSNSLNSWLNSGEFRPLKERLLERLNPFEPIRVIIQTGDFQLRRLPWHLWDFFERYPKAEVALSAPAYDSFPKIAAAKESVRILAILGDSEGIEVEVDRKFLEELPGAETVFLVEPQRKDINDQLWEQNWDILFFAGHSRTEGETGRIYINETDSLTIRDLKHGLCQAIERGLKLAIFNSCDGLGLARELEDLHIPQMIVMREPVPDRVAQEFLKYFLSAFAGGQSLYLAVRTARERLHDQGLESEIPGATWLPAICQHPAEVPPTWEGLGGICIRAEQPIPECPYQGLSAFREEHEQFFFGREAFTGQLVAAVKRKPLVAVIGSSGSGKSSVVFAGLVPRLKRTGRWYCAHFRPGSRPFDNLAAALMPLLESQTGGASQLATELQQSDREALLRGADRALQDIVERIVQRNAGTHRLLLVADQFEELYTLVPEASEHQRFLDVLLNAVNNAPGFTLILTLRADFFSQAIASRPLRDALQQFSPELLGPMNRQELQQAIALPAQQLGVQLEEGLTERLINAVSNSPGNLPLLEFALTQLWATQSDRCLTHQAYDEIGGVEESLANHAEAVYSKLRESDRQRVQRVFIQLVRPGEGTEDTRRLATRAEVGEENWDLVTRLASESARLVVSNRNEASSEETVEIVHEALIRGWGRLGQWMRIDRAFRSWQERLRAAMRQWETSGNDEGALLRGGLLAEAEDWQQRRSDELSPAEKRFIQNSLELRCRLRQEEETRQQRELEQIRQLLEEEEKARLAQSKALLAERKARKAAQMRTRVIVMAAAFAIAALTAGGFAWQQQQQTLLTQAIFDTSRNIITPDTARVLMNRLPDLLKLADRHRESGDVKRSLADYRDILTLTGKLQKQVAQNPELRRKTNELQTTSQKAENSLAKLISQHQLPQLEQDLKKGQWGNFREGTSPTDFENQFTPGALRKTYATLVRETGAKADWNNDGSINDQDEADRIPCQTLQDIDWLWRKFTGDNCGWYIQNSFYQAPKCSQLDGRTLTEKLISPPFEPMIKRLTTCKLAPESADLYH
jgi:hypothetical protein